MQKKKKKSKKVEQGDPIDNQVTANNVVATTRHDLLQPQAVPIPKSTIWSNLLARSTANATFTLRVRLPESENTVVFTFPQRLTIDQAKAEVFKSTPSLADLRADEWNFGYNEDDRLEVEFLRFCMATPEIESLIAHNEAVEVSLVPKSRWKKISGMLRSQNDKRHTFFAEEELVRAISDTPQDLEKGEKDAELRLPTPKRRTRSLPAGSDLASSTVNPSRVLSRTKGSGRLRETLKETAEDKRGIRRKLETTESADDAPGPYDPPYLTVDLWRYIFSFVSKMSHISTISLTCKAWYRIVSHDMKVCQEKMKIKQMLSRNHGLSQHPVEDEDDEDRSVYSPFPNAARTRDKKINPTKRLSHTPYSQIPPRVPSAPQQHEFPEFDDELSSTSSVPTRMRNYSWRATETGWIVPDGEHREFPAEPSLDASHVEAFEERKDRYHKKKKWLKDENKDLREMIGALKKKLREQKIAERKQEHQVMEVLASFSSSLYQMEALKKLTQLDEEAEDAGPSGPNYRFSTSDRFAKTIEGWEVLKGFVTEDGIPPDSGGKAAKDEAKVLKQEREKEKAKNLITRKQALKKKGKSLGTRKKYREVKEAYEVEKKIIKGNTWEGGIGEVKKAMDLANKELAKINKGGETVPRLQSKSGDHILGEVLEKLSDEKSEEEVANATLEELVDRDLARESARSQDSAVVNINRKEREKEKEREKGDDTPLSSREDTLSSSDSRGSEIPTVRIMRKDYLLGPESIRKICVGCLEKGKEELLKLTTDRQRQRYWIMKKDLMDAEGKFVNHILHTIMKMYLRPLKRSLQSDKPLIEAVDLEVIFGDFEEFYELHTQFYYMCVHVWQKGEFLGDTIYEYGMRMCSFAFRFVENHNLAIEQIKKLRAKNKRFRQWLEEREFSEESHFLDLMSLLAKPVGRLAYYKLMIEKYLSMVEPSERIYAPTKVLLESLAALLARLSATTEEEDLQRFQMVDLQAQKKSGRFVDFLKPGRQLIFKGKLGIHDPASGKTASYYALVCNDLLVYGKKLSRTKDDFHAKDVFSLHDANLVEPATDELKNALVLVTTEAPLILVCKSAEQKAQWKAALQRALASGAGLHTPVTTPRTPDSGSRTEYSIVRLPTIPHNNSPYEDNSKQ